MNRPLAVVVLACSLALLGLYGHARADVKRLRLGMKMEEVKQLLGAPKSMSRQVLLRRYIEQWHYDQHWIEFECVRGKDSCVIAIQSEP